MNVTQLPTLTRSVSICRHGDRHVAMPRPGNVRRHARFPTRILSKVAIGELNERFGVLFARTPFDRSPPERNWRVRSPTGHLSFAREPHALEPRANPGPLARMEEELGKACAI
jgi:hypothetical protein